eukprot:jgi/Galph1/4783/GphlegSOOS_G3495.1
MGELDIDTQDSSSSSVVSNQMSNMRINSEKEDDSNFVSPYGSVIKRTPLLDVLRQQYKKSRLRKMEQNLLNRCGNVQVLFENLHDPHNGAACIRTTEAHGIQHVHVIEAFEPFHYADGVAVSADKWITLHRYKNLYDAVSALKQENLTLVAACLDDDAIAIDEVDFSKYPRICVLFGNEERGLSKGIRQLADLKVYIPIHGFTQSFNLSVSCAIFLYHLKLKGIIEPSLTPEEMQELYTKWIIRGSRRAAHIIEKHNFHFPELVDDYASTNNIFESYCPFRKASFRIEMTSVGLSAPNTALPATATFAPALATWPMVLGEIPPSTSIFNSGKQLRSFSTLGTTSGINFCPPKPGSTVMTKTISTSPADT